MKKCRPRCWFTVYGCPGETTPYCVRCGAKNPRWPKFHCAYKYEKGGYYCHHWLSAHSDLLDHKPVALNFGVDRRSERGACPS